MSEAILIFAIILLVIFIVATVVSWAIEERPFWWPKPKPEHELELLAYEVLASDLIKNPADWEGDAYRLWNEKRGVAIWTANQAYGLGVVFDKTAGRETSVWPSDSRHSLPSEAKKMLWNAVKVRQAALVVDRFREPTA